MVEAEGARVAPSRLRGNALRVSRCIAVRGVTGTETVLNVAQPRLRRFRHRFLANDAHRLLPQAASLRNHCCRVALTAGPRGME